jgi:hypothetical protein
MSVNIKGSTDKVGGGRGSETSMRRSVLSRFGGRFV